MTLGLLLIGFVIGTIVGGLVVYDIGYDEGFEQGAADERMIDADYADYDFEENN